MRWNSFCDSGPTSSVRSTWSLLKAEGARVCKLRGDAARVPPPVGWMKEVLSWLCVPIWAASGEVPGGRQRC